MRVGGRVSGRKWVGGARWAGEEGEMGTGDEVWGRGEYCEGVWEWSEGAG